MSLTHRQDLFKGVPYSEAFLYLYACTNESTEVPNARLYSMPQTAKKVQTFHFLDRAIPTYTMTIAMYLLYNNHQKL